MQITNNSPSAGFIAWTGVVIKYRDVTYTIADGNSNKKFLWWDFTSPTVLQETDTMPALEDTDAIIIYNASGTYHIMIDTDIHGGFLIDGTVPAAALVETYVETTGNESIGGVKTFTDIPVLPSDNPDANYEAAHKKYVDDTAAAQDQASEISIADAGGLYTGTDVEAALQEALTQTVVQTMTNKRITKRVNTIVSSATPTPAGDTTDLFTITALAEAATFAAPSGTPTNGQALIIRIKDNGTARALAYNAIYREGEDIKFPTTTVVSKTMYLALIYNSTAVKFDLVGVVMGL